MFDFVDICRNVQTIMAPIVYSSENVKLRDGAYIVGSVFVINFGIVAGVT